MPTGVALSVSPRMPSSESSSCSDTTDSHQVWTDSDEEEQEVTSRRISRTNWTKGATIIDYIELNG